MDTEQKKEYIEAINKYYNLKSAYETGFSKMKNKIIGTKGLSWQEKRRQFVKTNPPCINCKRPVKTIFNILSESSDRQLIAKCGDRREPCPLNIVINLGSVTDLKENILNDKKDINILKKKIILEKNDLLFNYITASDAVDKFDEIKESIEGSTKMYEYLLELYTNIAHNPENEEEVHNLETNLNINIGNIKELIKGFEQTQNVQLVRDAVEIYVNEIIPPIEEMIEKTYAYRQVEYNEYTEKYELVQIPFEYSIEQMEFDISDKLQQGVVSFQMGMESVSLKIKEKKDRKERKSKKLVIREEEEEKEKGEEEEEKEIEKEEKEKEIEEEQEEIIGGGALEDINENDDLEEYDLGDEDLEEQSITSDNMLPKLIISDENMESLEGDSVLVE